MLFVISVLPSRWIDDRAAYGEERVIASTA